MQTLAQRLRNEGKKLGLNEGKKIGWQEGITEEKKQMAKKMLYKNFTIESIVEMTGLTEKEIRTLI